MIRNFEYGFTHGGMMHSDEVFATAFLRMIDKNFKIIRQFKRSGAIPQSDNILVFDIGLGIFDHHQKDAKLRPTGKKYSSVGLILKEFWKDMGLSELEYEYLDKVIVEKIDYCDNYGDLCDYASMIDYFNLSWNISKNLTEEKRHEAENEKFEKAVEFASEIIYSELRFYRAQRSNNSINKIEKIYSQAFIELSGEIYNSNNKNSFIKNINKYHLNLFNNDSFEYFNDKAIRFQNLFEKHNFKAGFVRVINCFNLGIPFERKRALDLATFILKNEILKALNEFEAKKYILDIYNKSKDNYLIFDIKGIPWVRTVTSLNDFKERKIDFVIYLNDDKTCGIQCVPNSFYLKNTQRIPFEEDIRGASLDKLEDYLEGLTFCHATGFYSVTKDLESAIKLIEKTSKK